MNEDLEVAHFERYYREHQGTMDTLAIKATWLALKGACTVHETRHGTRILAVTASYPTYNGILNKHIEK